MWIFDITIIMDTKAVFNKLLKGEYKVKSVDKKSEVWSNFGIIVDLEGNEKDFVSCKKCNQVMSHKKGSGTSGMKRHTCSILARGQPVLTDAAAKKQPPAASKSKAPTEQIKKKLLDLSVTFCAEDLRPFDTYAGRGFKEFWEEVSSSNIPFIFFKDRLLMGLKHLLGRSL